MTDDASPPYLSVASVEVHTSKISEVIVAFDEIVKLTLENEPGVKVYRYYRIKGTNIFVWISQFTDQEASNRHHQSWYVQDWLKSYPDRGEKVELYASAWTFYERGGDVQVGGFERVR